MQSVQIEIETKETFQSKEAKRTTVYRNKQRFYRIPFFYQRDFSFGTTEAMNGFMVNTTRHKCKFS